MLGKLMPATMAVRKYAMRPVFLPNLKANTPVAANVFLLVSHRPADKMIGFVSLEAGYIYEKKGKITAKIGGASHAMFADGGLAFAFKDGPLVKSMIRGQNLTVQGISGRGTLTVDTFSLSGFTAAYRAASKACGVKG